MDVEFIRTVKSACFFKSHHFYIESVAPIFKMKVQIQIPSNNDKTVLLIYLYVFSDLTRTSKTNPKVRPRNYYIILLIWSNIYFCMAGRVRRPIVREAP